MSTLASLNLHNFRSYAQARLDDLSSGFIVLCGPNGAGKTNILEAISLLTPGRGLRGARPGEMQSQGRTGPWAVAGAVATSYGQVQMGTGLDHLTQKRVMRINGMNVRTQAALASHFSCVWVTPQMDRLFIDSSAQRRKFLDRLVFSGDAGHAGRLARYENAMGQRSRLLRDGRAEESWLGALEGQMAEAGIAIAAARSDLCHRLQTAVAAAPVSEFPRAHLRAAGTLEALLEQAPALEVEEIFRYQLRQSRTRDAQTGGASTGIHKSDLAVRFEAKNMPADQCSTGEQKSLLIGLVLAHARLIAAERGHPPALLLDEVAAHLDESRRGALYAHLADLGAQVWLTGTEENLFAPLSGAAQIFEVRGGVIVGFKHAA